MLNFVKIAKLHENSSIFTKFRRITLVSKKSLKWQEIPKFHLKYHYSYKVLRQGMKREQKVQKVVKSAKRAKKCKKCSEVQKVAKSAKRAEKCKKCESHEIHQNSTKMDKEFKWFGENDEFLSKFM